MIAFAAVKKFILQKNWDELERSKSHIKVFCLLMSLLIDINVKEAQKVFFQFPPIFPQGVLFCIDSIFKSALNMHRLNLCGIEVHIDKRLYGASIAQKISHWLCILPREHIKGTRRIVVVPKDEVKYANGIYYYPLEDVIKLVWRRQLVPFYIPKRYRYSRQYILYHEIGHYLYQHNGQLSREQAEEEADNYAASMLEISI